MGSGEGLTTAAWGRAGTSPSARQRQSRQAERAGRGGYRLVAAVLVPVAVLLGVRTWLVEPVVVSSDSMEPTITTGAVVLLYKPGVSQVRNGAVVAFDSPADGHSGIKRVVAGEGQSVAIRDAELFVDNVAVPEPFVDHSRIDATYFGPVRVPAGHVFVLGDNRSVSIDSRDYGAVPLAAVQGTILTGGQ